MFTKHTRQVSGLLLLQMQGAHPKPTGPWAEGPGKDVPTASRPCLSLGQGVLL